MPDLGTQIRRYVDATAPPIELDEVTRAEPVVAEPRRPGRRRVLAIAATVAFVVIVAAAVVASRSDHTDQGAVSVGSTTSSTVPPVTEPGWLTPFGTETATPVLPSGWEWVDVADLRFGVPSDWEITGMTVGCFSNPTATGVVWVVGGTPGSCSGPASKQPASALTLRWEPVQGEGEVVRVGTLAARTVVHTLPGGAHSVYQFADGIIVSASGPLADRVLATFTDSGYRRALQRGPVADTSGWRTVTYQGVAFRVPPSWHVVDLPSAFTQTTDPSGVVSSEGGEIDPGACGGSMFPSDPDRVSLGVSKIMPSCPFTPYLALQPGLGAWIRSSATGTYYTPITGPMVAQGRLGGLGIRVVGIDAHASPGAQPVLNLLVQHGREPFDLTIGVGTDASIVRAILLSLHAA
jgi:hypothetical protein